MRSNKLTFQVSNFPQFGNKARFFIIKGKLENNLQKICKIQIKHILSNIQPQKILGS